MESHPRNDEGPGATRPFVYLPLALDFAGEPISAAGESVLRLLLRGLRLRGRGGRAVARLLRGGLGLGDPGEAGLLALARLLLRDVPLDHGLLTAACLCGF